MPGDPDLVAGPAALLVAKVHKIADRTGTATLAARLVELAGHRLRAEVMAGACVPARAVILKPRRGGHRHGGSCGTLRRRRGGDLRVVYHTRFRSSRRIPP